MCVILVLECLYSVINFLIGIESCSVDTQGHLVIGQRMSGNWAGCPEIGHGPGNIVINAKFHKHLQSMYSSLLV